MPLALPSGLTLRFSDSATYSISQFVGHLSIGDASLLWPAGGTSEALTDPHSLPEDAANEDRLMPVA